ncbi:MAG: hypothetical protein LBB64_00530 [Dysgonamonadaceae bacterium]|jgi:hypothetical protein|nr:hypothetical protein [Dysgonamonadaceae bacterium]
MVVRYSEIASAIIETYFEDYIGTPSHNDMVQRAYRISRIRACLSQIHVFDTYVLDGRNLVDIDDFCTVEYAIEKEGMILVKNIYFHNKPDDNSFMKFFRY